MEQQLRTYISQNVNSFNVTNVTDDRSRILTWISSLESWKRHHDLSAARVRGIGNWILETPEFQEWREGDNGGLRKVLLCCGIPGAGKTFICSLVTDHLCDSEILPNIGVACLYCDYSGWKEQTPVGMISSLLRQFVTGMSEIPKELTEAFRAAKGSLGGRALKVEKIIDIFPKVLEYFDRTFICIDALDEFRVEDRAMFLQLLKTIIDKSSNTRLFLTGRLHIRLELDKQINRPFATITIQPRHEDIRQYLTMKLNNDFEDGAMDDELREEIITNIARKDSEIFLLVALHIDAILGEITIGGRREKLHQIGDDLSDAYSATIHRIKGQSRERSRSGMATLMWISLAERPLSVEELCHALAVKVGTSDLDPEKVPSIQSVLGCCLGLVTVDKETSTVRLIHATLQEHLQSQQDIFESPHTSIAEVCLSYLGFQSLQRLSVPLEESSLETHITPTHISARLLFLESVSVRLPLLEYASCYWGIHAHKGLTPSIEQGAINLLKQYPESIAAKVFLKNNDFSWRSKCDSDGFSGLHYASWTGIYEIVAALLRTGNCEVNQKDASGRTPLSLATRNGHEEVVEMLLECLDVDPNSAEEDGRTPLSWAIKYGYERVARLLLNRPDVNPNLTDNEYGQTPLSWAAECGYDSMVKILLDRADIDPDLADKCGQTPLSWAATYGCEGVVRLLLTRADANPNLADNEYGQTPLSLAAERGYGSIVKFLLDRADIDPDLADKCGRTPLSWAATHGHEGVVRLLLTQADINPNLADGEHCQTPLSLATKRGHGGVVKILLGRADINPNLADKRGRTPLSWAVICGYEGVVNSLLDRQDVSSFLTNSDGQTTLHLAAKSGHHSIVKLLLERTDLYPDALDMYLRTPLSWASGNGHLEVVELLLHWTDADPDSADIYGRTPLSRAVEAGFEAEVALLLSRNDVSCDIVDIDGQTPLFHAAGNGYNGIVGQLLNHRDVDTERQDNNGRTVLSWAAGNGNEEVVNTLLEWTDIPPDLSDHFGRTALSWAAGEGYRKVVELLLARTDVNAEFVDIEGRSPLCWALENGNEDVVAVLREWTGRPNRDVGTEVLQSQLLDPRI